MRTLRLRTRVLNVRGTGRGDEPLASRPPLGWTFDTGASPTAGAHFNCVLHKALEPRKQEAGRVSGLAGGAALPPVCPGAVEVGVVIGDGLNLGTAKVRLRCLLWRPTLLLYWTCPGCVRRC